MRSRSSAPAEPVPGYATTLHLVGDRVACAGCERVDFAVRFLNGGVPVCEDCEPTGVGNVAQGEV